MPSDWSLLVVTSLLVEKRAIDVALACEDNLERVSRWRRVGRHRRGLCDGRVTLEQNTKFCFELNCMTLLVVAEEIRESVPYGLSEGIGLHDDVKDLHGDRVILP